MFTLRSYIYKTLSKHFQVGLLCIALLTLAIQSVSLHIAKYNSLENQLSVTLKTIKAATDSGNWNIATEYLAGVSRSQNIYDIVVHLQENQIAGPIGTTNFSIWPLCKDKSLGDYKISACISTYDSSDLYYFLVLFFIISVFLFLSYLLIDKRISFVITKLSEDLNNIPHAELLERHDDILEIHKLKKQFNHLLSEAQEKNKLEIINSTAKQVAHDIRSPLQALKVSSDFILKDPQTSQNLIKEAIKRIEQINSDLREKKTLHSSYSLNDCILSTVSLKEIEHQNVDIRMSLDKEILFSKYDDTTISRFISNLINNSVEAKSTAINISTYLKENEGLVILEVRDNGIGIPKELIAKVGYNQFTYGKIQGQGLGLTAINKVLSELGDYLEIESNESKGTIVRVVIKI